MTEVTALSLPRCRERFRVCHLQPYRLADDLLKRLEVPNRCPDLQLGLTVAMQLNDDVFATVVYFEARDRLRVAAVQAFRDAED